MILDAYGRPTRRPVSFITPQWLTDTCAAILRDEVDAYSRLSVEMRVHDLYASADCSREREIGNIVRVNAPPRFKQG